MIWEASDRVCSKRLRPLVPILLEAMERHGHLQLAPEVRTSVLAMSAATIDRMLREIRGQAGSRTRQQVAHAAALALGTARVGRLGKGGKQGSERHRATSQSGKAAPIRHYVTPPSLRPRLIRQN